LAECSSCLPGQTTPHVRPLYWKRNPENGQGLADPGARGTNRVINGKEDDPRFGVSPSSRDALPRAGKQGLALAQGPPLRPGDHADGAQRGRRAAMDALDGGGVCAVGPGLVDKHGAVGATV